MNPFQFPVTCEVCGGDGVGTIRTAGAAWDTNKQVRHVNPRVCADYLSHKAAELAKREKQFEKVNIRERIFKATGQIPTSP